MDNKMKIQMTDFKNLNCFPPEYTNLGFDLNLAHST